MISENDIDWLKWNYPGVYLIPNKEILEGCLWFRMNYSFLTGEGIINPLEHMETENSLTLEDVYQLTIEINDSKKKIIVKETGKRILGTKYKWRLSQSDVHMYEDGSLCLCPKPEEELLFYEGFSLKSFFYRYLIPNLYYHTYLNRFGKEPWKSSNHGDMGILESYARQEFLGLPQNIVIDSYVQRLPSYLMILVTSNKKIDQNLLCGCGSGKRFRDCHTSGFRGLEKLNMEYRSFMAGKSKR